jgi:hypothetical protein
VLWKTLSCDISYTLIYTNLSSIIISLISFSMHKRIIGSAIIMVLTISQVLFSFPSNMPEVNEAHAATRLGLHVTQEELNCWRERAGIDPQGSNGITCPVKYKTAGDVSTNSPGDWTRIANQASTFRSTPTRDFWDGSVGHSGCVVFGDSSALPNTNLALGESMHDAAFYFLLT